MPLQPLHPVHVDPTSLGKVLFLFGTQSTNTNKREIQGLYSHFILCTVIRQACANVPLCTCSNKPPSSFIFVQQAFREASHSWFIRHASAIAHLPSEFCFTTRFTGASPFKRAPMEGTRVACLISGVCSCSSIWSHSM